MSAFHLSGTPLDTSALRATLKDPAAGGYASFEGWVRNHNEGHPVMGLEYQAYEALAIQEGQSILEEAKARFAILDAACAHRTGKLAITELAVWVGVSAHHRAAAFAACRYIIDEVKRRLPVWKKEYYADGS